MFVETRVVDSSGEEVGPGSEGEMLYRSPQLCEGYWNRPEATAEAFDNGWFHSGDLVKVDEDGYVEVVDRVKDVINTGGVLVASREVEDVVFELPQVAEVAVVGVADETWIEAISAFIVINLDHGELTGKEVNAIVKARLAGFKVPKRVERVAQSPKNQAVKIRKCCLRKSNC